MRALTSDMHTRVATVCARHRFAHHLPYDRQQAETDFFFELIALPRRPPKPKTAVELARAEALLFAEPSLVGINFNQFDKIHVKSQGRDCHLHPPLADFQDLFESAPDSVFARNIRLMGYAKPTPVQRHAIPFALAGRDLLCTSQTGSGKTAALLSPWFLRAPQQSTIPPSQDLGVRGFFLGAFDG